MIALATRLCDRLNPVLVKEVRQALNGRLFRIGYGLSLIGALCIALAMLMTGDGSQGGQLALAMFGCLLVSIFVFVPCWAFVSMGAEWEENTWDLLVLSNLGPWRIVAGKLGSAAVQALLSFCAFLPFFVFAFLLRGVNLPTLLLLLGGAIVISPCLSLVAIGLSSLAAHRFARVALMIALLGGLIALTAGAMALVSSFTMVRFFRPELSQQVLVVSGFVTAALAIGGFFGAIACGRLAHAEENRSTGVRVALLLAVLAALAWYTYGCLTEGAHHEVVSGMGIALATATFLPCAFFALEPEPLGRRVARHVPRHRLLALLAVPFLPGGGRGLLYWLGMTGLIGGAALASVLLFSDASSGPVPRRLGVAGWDGLDAMLGTFAFAGLYVGVPSLFVARRSTPQRRALARVSIFLLVPICLFLPAIAGFLTSGGARGAFDHALNPFFVIPALWDGGLRIGHESMFGLVVDGVVLAFLFQIPRMLRGVREVGEASEARRAAARAAVRALPPPEPLPDAASGA